MVKFTAPDAPLKSLLEQRVERAETMLRRTWRVLAPNEDPDFFEIDTKARRVVRRLDDLASVAAEAQVYCQASGADDLAARLRSAVEAGADETLEKTEAGQVLTVTEISDMADAGRGCKLNFEVGCGRVRILIKWPFRMPEQGIDYVILDEDNGAILLLRHGAFGPEMVASANVGFAAQVTDRIADVSERADGQDRNGTVPIIKAA
jgi:predicted transcriptional regulator